MIFYLGAAAALEARASSEVARPSGKLWNESKVLSQGAGATPGYRQKQGQLVWSYAHGTSHAQQQVLLRADTLPEVGKAVEVRLFPEEYSRRHQDFAGLAFSMVGVEPNDRSGLLLFFLKAASWLPAVRYGPTLGC